MAIDTTTPRTRRALLAGTVAGLAALAAQAIGRPAPVSAHDPDDVRLGAANSATDQTRITNTTTNGTAFVGSASGGGVGVWGYSPSGTGVKGYSLSGTRPAVLAVAAGDNTGLQGYSGDENFLPASPAKTGAFGYAGQDSTSVGVYGETPTGTGVRGHSDSHVGVYGSSGSGAPAVNLKVGVYGWGPATTGLAPSYGVYGKSASGLGTGVFGVCDAGIGVAAISQTGFALYAGGRVLFKTSGIANIAAGSASTVVTPGVPIADSTRILVTLHGDPGDGTVLKRVSKNTTAGTFKVILTASSANACAFSWFLIG